MNNKTTYYAYPGIPFSPTQIVSDITGIPTNTIYARTRKREIVKARKIVILTKHLAGNKICHIAKEFKVNHATIIHSLRTLKEELQTTEPTRLMVAKAINRLQLVDEYNQYLQKIKKEFWI